VRYGLLGRLAGGDSLAGALSAIEGVASGRRQPIRQDGEGLLARPADSPAYPDAIALGIMALAEAPPVANDRVVPADWTSPRQEIQRHPGTMLSFVSGSAIKRITAGVKARR